jgi:transcriptional regulator with XRE-family HTH domain
MKTMTAETFAAHRASMRLTQARLANLIGISTRQIIRYEMGQSKIPNPVSILVDLLDIH